MSADDLLAEARERSDALLAQWSELLGVEMGGRIGAALGYALFSPPVFQRCDTARLK